LRDLAGQGLLRSAQDVSDGGLAVALAECVMLGGCGAILRFEHRSLEVALFSEDQGRVVVTCADEDVEAMIANAGHRGVGAVSIGRTGGDHLAVEGAFDLSVDALRAAWDPEA
jgi:phosphoribosylformylglycinamidine synthase subunit PurL